MGKKSAPWHQKTGVMPEEECFGAMGKSDAMGKKC